MSKKPFSVSESDFAAWLVCHLRYLYRSIGVKKSQPSLHKVVGDATHEAAAEEDATVREAIVAKHVERLPEEQRAEGKVMMEAQIKRADKHEEDEEPVIGQEKEKLERWRVPGTDREFVMKSDKIGWGVDDLNRQHLRITDMKSGLNPDWLIWKTKMELSIARMNLARLEKNRNAVASRVSLLEEEAAKHSGSQKVALEKKLSYQLDVLDKESAKTEEALIVVKKLAAKLSRSIRKFERVRTQLFFFAMVAEQTRDYHHASQLVAQFLGEVTREERANVEQLKKDYQKHFGEPQREPNPNGFEFWYQPEMGAEALERYLEQIPAMEEAREKRDAEATTGKHCFDCDYRDSCPAFQAWQAARNGSNLIALTVKKPEAGKQEKTA
ncbi:MAG: PD-(D/E)XK nuclease family protein [Candidatus Melainabacteria bacterium]|nr:PD-(D/E)XK nuclease family protein [Candidatus Melainabacteria bacterium]